MRLSVGISGLDEVLLGGFISERAYLIRGSPGAGKTTLGLHFLFEGLKNKEPVLFVTLSETEKNIRTNAKGLNLPINDIDILDLSPESDFFKRIETYDIFSPAEVEREPVTKKIVETIEHLNPKRVFIDSVTQMRYLATDVYNYRRQVLAFLRFLKEKGITVLFPSEHSLETPDDDLQFISDGIVTLSFCSEKGRSLAVTKFRGSAFKRGRHSFKITDEGITVYPNVVPEEIEVEIERKIISSGILELDDLLNGGIERGTVTIISGPSGVGKSTLGAQFIKEAAKRGENSAIYLFEENIDIFIKRCESINTPVKEMIKRGTFKMEFVEPLLYSADEFSSMVRKDIEKNNLKVVMIDSLHGYRLAVRHQNLEERLYSLCKSLVNKGVSVVLVNEIGSITGEFRATEIGISYVADNIIFLRYLEIKGELKKAIGVLKKSLSDFEKTLREFEITKDGIKIGPPLVNLRGILKGVPEWEK